MTHPSFLDPTHQPDRRWGGGDIATGMIMALSLSSLFTILYVNLADLHEGERSLGLVIASFLGIWLGMGGTLWGVSRFKGQGSWHKDFGLHIEWPRDLGLGLLLGFGAQLTSLVIYLPLNWLAPEIADKVSGPAESITDTASGPGVLLLFVAVCVVAPLLEEIFFRGLALRAFKYRWGPKIGILFSSLLFGIAHLELLQAPALIIIGIIFGIAANKTGRLGPSIFGHCIFNSMSFLFLFLSS